MQKTKATTRWILAGLVAAAAACGDEAEDGARPSDPAASGGAGASGEAQAEWTGGDLEAEAPAVELPKLSELHPVIRAQSESGLPPERVVVHLSRWPDVGFDPATTRLTVEPAIAGALAFEGRSSIVFTPSEPWQPKTEYRFTLEAIGTAAGLIEADGTYARVFETPPFELVRADLLSFDRRNKRMVVELVFSGPVDHRALMKHLKPTVSGEFAGAVHRAGPKPHVVHTTLSHRLLNEGVDVRLELTRGLEMKGARGHTAPPARRTVRLPEGKPMTIHFSSVQEGTDGFYVKVICSDDANSTNRMYYWDREAGRSFRISPRCVLDEEDAKDSLHFDPPVAYTLSPTRGGFRVLGDFARGSYSMRIDADARTADGGVLKRPYTTSFTVPARKPSLSFVTQGRYLPRDAWKSLGIEHMNLDEVKVRIHQIRPANLVFWMTGDSEAANERNSDVILEEKIALSGTPDAKTTSFVDVQGLLSEPPQGVLQISLSDEKDTVTARARVLVTDINLVAKQVDKTAETRVWALDIHTGAPLSGVTMQHVVASGRVLSTCETDGADGCVLKGPAEGAVDDSRPVAIVARRGRDLTYLKYDELRSTPDGADLSGRAYETKTPYTAALYADRGVYRPGETAHVSAIVRDEGHVAPPSGMPVQLELVDPRSRVAKKLTERTNRAGMIAVDLSFADFADTGRYRVVAKAGKKEIGQLSFSVEEFVPERMKVTARPLAEDLLIEDVAQVQVDAKYLFGGSAEGSRYEVRCELAPARFRPEKNGQYTYSVWHETAPRPIPLGSASGTLDGEGQGTLACPSLTGRGRFTGPARVDVQVAVFESGSGRTTQTQARAYVHPARHYVGLDTGVEKAKAGQRVAVKGVVVDWTGAPVSTVSEVTLSVFRVEREHDWIYDDREGRWTYRQFSRLAREGGETVAVKGGKFSFQFTPAGDAAGFVVRAEADGAQADLPIDGHRPYWWSWTDSSGQDRTPRPLKPASLAVSVPKTAQVGAPIDVTFTPPFAGKALVSLEADGILAHEWIDVEAKPTTWTVTAARFHPNVYASVFVVKDPHLESKAAFIPNRAFGASSIRLEPTAFRQPLTLKAPKEVRSSSELSVTLDFGEVEPGTFATVAAVDEGILQLTKFQSPNPFETIFDKRALGLSSYETIGWNLLLPAGDAGRSTGGGADGKAPGRVQPVKPVALWSGVRPVPEDGKLTVTFEVPEYRGSLRVMAVAAGPKKMAQADTNVIVRDPLTLQATLPRFMTRGDVAHVPVFVTNLSGQRRAVKVRVEVKPRPVGGLLVLDEVAAKSVVTVRGAETRSLTLEDEKNGTVVFSLEARQPVGAATIRVVATSDDLSSETSLDVPILPAAPKTRVVQRIELEDGKTDLLPLLKGWMPTTESSTFWVTANPYGDTFDHLKYLIRYPYGCIEQTTSSTRPLLFLGELMANVDPKLVADGRVDKMVRAGVERVLSMQTPSGGFAYWPGRQEPVPWGTAYGLHMLLDAKERRYEVPQHRLDDALDWVERTLTHKYGGASTHDRYYGRQAEAYLHFVLARAGRGRKARMKKLLAEVERETKRSAGERAEDAYMLQAGLFLAGDRTYESQLRAPDTSPLSRDRRNSWSFYSDRRRRGFMLSTFADLFGSDAQGEPLAQLVAEGLRGHGSGWYTTQELVWGITGLGKYLGEVSGSFAPPKLLGNGRRLDAQDVAVRSASGAKETEDRGERTWSLYRASEYRSLELDVDRDKDQRLFLVVSSEGVREGSSYVTGGDGLRLSRTYHAMSGEPLSVGDGTKLGDLVYVRVDLENTTGERVQNIALVDRFPAGWELENPRLSRGGGAIDWVDASSLWSVEHMNLRDDRVELFGALGRGQSKSFVYVLRATTAGTFTIPPVEAEAMYDPTRWAREAGGRAVVNGPWDVK